MYLSIHTFLFDYLSKQIFKSNLTLVYLNTQHNNVFFFMLNVVHESEVICSQPLTPIFYAFRHQTIGGGPIECSELSV